MIKLLDACGVSISPEASSWGSTWETTPRRTRGEPRLEAFSFFSDRLSHDRLALSGAGDNKPDALNWNHGAAALFERLRKTGKKLKLACGSRYERLIDESDHLVDSSLRGWL